MDKGWTGTLANRAAGVFAGVLFVWSLGFVLGPVAALAAGVANVRLEERVGLVVVTYDLEGPRPAPVRLVGSADGGKTFTLKVESVEGDVGPSVSPGRGKTVLWHMKRDHPKGLGEADVVLEVRAGEPAGGGNPGTAQGDTYFVIPFRGHVGMEITRPILEQALAEAEKVRPTVLIAEIDSPGGLASECSAIIGAIRTWLGRHPEQRAAAFITGRARSGGAALAAIWPEVYLMPSSVAGATVAEEGEDWPLPIPENGILSAAADALGISRSYGRNPVLVEAALDPRVELWFVGGPTGRAEVLKVPPSPQRAPSVRRLCGEKSPLTLSAEQAVELGFATAVVKDYADLGRRMGLAGWREATDAGRRVTGAHAAKAGRLMTEFSNLHFTLHEARDRYVDPGNRQLSGKHANYWAMCKSLFGMIELAGEHPYLAAVLKMEFPGGTGTGEQRCDQYDRSRR